MSLFDFKDVSLKIGDTTILQRVSMSMQAGEIVTIVGPNGSGKSTLLRLLIGSLAPTGGRVTKAPKLRIGYVPQRLAIDPTLPMTAADLLGLRRKLRPAQISPGARGGRASAGSSGDRSATCPAASCSG